MNASEQIDNQIASFPDWRGVILTQIRKIFKETDPDIVEDWKWSTAVYTKNGMIGAMSAFRDHVKINFFKGVALPDPHHIINAGFTSKEHRGIDFYEGDKINEPALKELIRAAVSYNSN